MNKAAPDEKQSRKPLPMQPSKYYPGVGKCIYCLRKDVLLTDEHIVPLAWGGNHVMRSASCHECSAKTSAIERHLLRDYWGKPRDALNFPTRRAKRRSDKLEIRIAEDEGERIVDVDWEKFPAIFGLPLLGKPGRMRGVAPSRECLIFGTWLATCGPNTAMDHQVTETLRIDDFIAFIAKLAHSYVFAQLGPEAFTFWQALPSVIDRSYPFQCYLIGGIDGEKPITPMTGTTNFSISFTLHSQIVDGLEFLTVGVQMFSDVGGPTYAAIFGARPSSTEKPTKFACS